MSTSTFTNLQTARRRRALSLIARHRSPLLSLPLELLLTILEIALLESRPSTIAVVSKDIYNVINAILYHTVVLFDPIVTNLFHRTIKAKSSTFFATHVKRLVIAWQPVGFHLPLQDIIAACSDVRTLVSPSFHSPISVFPTASCHPSPGEIILKSYDELDDQRGHILSSPLPPSGYANFASLSHLRLCEPGDRWSSPYAMLRSFGPLPLLSHLQLARRTGANEDNDVLFTEDVCNILRDYSSLKVLVISLFNGQSWCSSTVTGSNIWALINEVCARDKRVVIREGHHGEWMEECTSIAYMRNNWNFETFWAPAQRGSNL